MIRVYKDIPVALSKLYQEPDYIKNRHGLDLQVTFETSSGVSGKKKKRIVTLIKDSFTAEEEHVFQKLHNTFQTLSEQFGNKSIFEITDAFMRVSGDVEALKKYMQGVENLNCIWTYQDDISLSLPDNSSEYRELLMRKGRFEIDKRKQFLLSTGVQQQQPAAAPEQEMQVD